MQKLKSYHEKQQAILKRKSEEVRFKVGFHLQLKNKFPVLEYFSA